MAAELQSGSVISLVVEVYISGCGPSEPPSDLGRPWRSKGDRAVSFMYHPPTVMGGLSLSFTLTLFSHPVFLPRSLRPLVSFSLSFFALLCSLSLRVSLPPVLLVCFLSPSWIISQQLRSLPSSRALLSVWIKMSNVG